MPRFAPIVLGGGYGGLAGLAAGVGEYDLTLEEMAAQRRREAAQQAKEERAYQQESQRLAQQANQFGMSLEETRRHNQMQEALYGQRYRQPDLSGLERFYGVPGTDDGQGGGQSAAASLAQHKPADYDTTDWWEEPDANIDAGLAGAFPPAAAPESPDMTPSAGRSPDYQLGPQAPPDIAASMVSFSPMPAAPQPTTPQGWEAQWHGRQRGPNYVPLPEAAPAQPAAPMTRAQAFERERQRARAGRLAGAASPTPIIQGDRFVNEAPELSLTPGPIYTPGNAPGGQAIPPMPGPGDVRQPGVMPPAPSPASALAGTPLSPAPMNATGIPPDQLAFEDTLAQLNRAGADQRGSPVAVATDPGVMAAEAEKAKRAELLRQQIALGPAPETRPVTAGGVQVAGQTPGNAALQNPNFTPMLGPGGQVPPSRQLAAAPPDAGSFSPEEVMAARRQAGMPAPPGGGIPEGNAPNVNAVRIPASAAAPQRLAQARQAQRQLPPAKQIDQYIEQALELADTDPRAAHAMLNRAQTLLGQQSLGVRYGRFGQDIYKQTAGEIAQARRDITAQARENHASAARMQAAERADMRRLRMEAIKDLKQELFRMPNEAEIQERVEAIQGPQQRTVTTTGRAAPRQSTGQLTPEKLAALRTAARGGDARAQQARAFLIANNLGLQ